MARRILATALFSVLAVQASPLLASGAQLGRSPHVYGEDIDKMEILDGSGKSLKSISFRELASFPLTKGTYQLAFSFESKDVADLEIPPCAGRAKVMLDGTDVPSKEPVIIGRTRTGGKHEVRVSIQVSDYERRIACGYPPRFGTALQSNEELRTLTFVSAARAVMCHGECSPGKALVYVPRAHDEKKPSALLVGLHPWNGSPWTYAAYAELLKSARDKDVVLLFPSGLGNSLYTEEAEKEVVRAIDELGTQIAIDPARISIWGASMGGAGATTIGFHVPDRFATITSFFGDSKYDLTTYVKGILPNENTAKRVNALDAIENVRHVPVWLVHGDQDKVSPIRQSEMLFASLSERGFSVRFDREQGKGHEGMLVAKHLPALIELAAKSRTPISPTRVSYKSVRGDLRGAYGVQVIRQKQDAEALLDVEVRGGKIVFLAHANVKEVVLTKGALGISEILPIAAADGISPLPVRIE